MDVMLTDLLVCPHCGPPYALILLAERVSERRVLAGTLGCANCYRRYAVREGLADLRPAAGGGPEAVVPAVEVSPGSAQATSPGAEPASPTGLAQETDHAMRLAALMGLSDATGAGRAIALVAGPAAAEAEAVARVAEGYEIVVAEADGGGVDVAGLPEAPGISRILVAERLPFADGSVRGVALRGASADRLLEEGLRVLNPMARLVLEDAPPGAAERVAAAGGRVVASEGSTVVAVTLRAPGRGP